MISPSRRVRSPNEVTLSTRSALVNSNLLRARGAFWVSLVQTQNDAVLSPEDVKKMGRVTK
jgi:hypothetical protein